MARTESLKRAREAVSVSHEGREGADMKRKGTQQPAGGRSSAKGKAEVSKAVLVAKSAAGAIAASAEEEGTSVQSPLAPKKLDLQSPLPPRRRITPRFHDESPLQPSPF